MAELLLFNPWWENAGNIELDRYISAYQQSLIQWRPAGFLSEDILKTYLTVIRSDFEKIKKRRILLRHVLIRVLSILWISGFISFAQC